MSGMDRLTAIERLRLHIDKDFSAPDLSDLLEEIEALEEAHRRASQAAPAPDDQFVTTLPQEAFDAFAKACEDAPAPSDGLREALTDDDLMIFIQKRLANELRVAGWHDAAEYLIDDYMGQQIIRAMTDCRNARAALSASPAQEGEPRHG